MKTHLLKRMTLCLAIFALTSAAYGQSQNRRATMTGTRGDRGKCTIEVNVDDVAEIEIAGEMGELHTLSGQPSGWVRFECSDPLPRNPTDFKFSGIDGRGRQTLIRDPRNNRGVAVIRIEDRNGGREGYTFDIEWRGYANNNSGRSGGFDDPRGPNNNNPAVARAVDACRDAVRQRAERDYGYRNLTFDRMGFENNRGANDTILGRFTFRRGLSQEEFEFSCSVNMNNGRIRNVQLRRY